MSTTHVDRHGERMALEALEAMIECIETTWLPIGVEHDPRKPPIGRLLCAELQALDNGEHALVGTMEIWEKPEDIVECEPGRSLSIRPHALGASWVDCDRNFRNAEDQEIIGELGVLLNCKPGESVKKALDPISILTIGGSFLAGTIAATMLKRLGDDAYAALKSKLKQLFSKAKSGEAERLLQFLCTVEEDKRVYEVQIILTNPSPEDIDLLFNRAILELDQLSRRLTSETWRIKRIVFELTHGKLELRFAVRDDAVPMRLTLSESQNDDSWRNDA